MICRILGLSALVASASAILLPPTVTATDLDLGDDSAMEISVNPMKRTFALECPKCAFATKEAKTAYTWSQNTGSTYLLDFDVGTNEDSLVVEGVQLYPPSYGSRPFFVTQLDPTTKDALRLMVTGYTFHFTSAATVTEAGIELLPVTLKITSIEGRPTHPPALTVNLLKDTNGRLMIASFQTTQADENDVADQEAECNEWPMLCQWRSYLSNGINDLKSSVSKACHRHKSSNPMADAGFGGKPPHRFRPGHPHHHPHNGPLPMGDHHRHHHHSHHNMNAFLRRAFFTVLIPILIGIFAGTLTYLIGLALGYVIAIVVAKVRGRAPYQRIALEDEEQAEHVENSGEKEAFIAELPEYDAPPVYEEASEKEAVEGQEPTDK